MAITDKITQVAGSAATRPVTATLAAPGYSIGGSSITVTAATGWTTNTAIHFVIYETETISGQVIKDTSTQRDFKGTLSGTTISNLTLTGGVDRDFSAGAIVELTPTAGYARDLYTGLTNEHDVDGAHTDVTADTLTLTDTLDVSGDTTLVDVGAADITSTGTIKTDTIAETTSDNGVAIDGGTIKNGVFLPRETSSASAASVTPDADTKDFYVFTALAETLTINEPTGSPVNGQKLIFRIEDDGGAETLTWDAAYREVGVDLLTTTTAGKVIYVGCLYNSTDAVWDVILVNEEE